MLDTSLKVEARVHKMMRKKSGAERLMMGCSMFDMSKRIVEDSIKHNNPNIGEEELRVQLFLRFYKHDFNEEERERIIKHLRRNCQRT